MESGFGHLNTVPDLPPLDKPAKTVEKRPKLINLKTATKAPLPRLRISMTEAWQALEKKEKPNQNTTRLQKIALKSSEDQEREDTVFAIPNDSDLADSGIKLKKQVSEVSIGSAVFAEERKLSESLKQKNDEEMAVGENFIEIGREHRNFTSFCEHMPSSAEPMEEEKENCRSRRNLVDAMKELELEQKMTYNEKRSKNSRFGHTGGLGLSKRQK